jgi:hypothetical protein
MLSGDSAHRESGRLSVKVNTRYGDFSPIDRRVSHAGLRTITGEMEI